jgi:cupin fold WbuC family metalloprotein
MDDRLPMRDVAPGVQAAGGPIVTVAQADLDELRRRTRREGRSQRLLLHPGIDDELHEMLIVHPRGIYVRPHLMARSSKTYMMVEGEMAMVLFGDDGTVEARHLLRDGGRGGPFLLRLMERRFHTVVPLTETAAFLEILPGPFRGTVFAPWAPAADGGDAAAAYGRRLRDVVGGQA